MRISSFYINTHNDLVGQTGERDNLGYPDVGGRIIYMMDTKVTRCEDLEAVRMPQNQDWRGGSYVKKISLQGKNYPGQQNEY
jgi:hypothetical protein